MAPTLVVETMQQQQKCHYLLLLYWCITYYRDNTKISICHYRNLLENVFRLIKEAIQFKQLLQNLKVQLLFLMSVAKQLVALIAVVIMQAE